MDKFTTSWYSHRLSERNAGSCLWKIMDLRSLLVPTAAADFLEYERFQLIDSLAAFY